MSERKRLDIRGIIARGELTVQTPSASGSIPHTLPNLNPTDLMREVRGPENKDVLDRIRADVGRHKAAGRYDPARTLCSIERYVVEPAAIALGAESDTPWFRLYRKGVREEVAQTLLREVEEG